ncbi:cysteine proteinase inhibitor-like [Macadamia integrifolia]|uniref:cysteine proteinase inhibitor-like n=1 Tax=Macadamia integrifolia TaxID=60698 RepID=UPI001C4F4B76|nr:cysteine proteinase inhibitor-like [Macadamia integrifolia]
MVLRLLFLCCLYVVILFSTHCELGCCNDDNLMNMNEGNIPIFLEPGPLILPNMEPMTGGAPKPGAVEAKTGGIHEVKGFQNSVETDELARFAIDEYNKKQNKVVEFGRVVNVKEQVVTGTIYYLTLEVVEGGKKTIYEAKVWVKPWMNFKELQEFKPSI